MKKIKSRFFKFYVNKFIVNFCNYMNYQDVFHFNSKVFFSRLKNYFVKDATIKRHREWKLIDKSMLDIFFEYSDMKLEEIYSIYKKNEDLFANIVKKLDKETKFVVLKSFKEVFNNFISNEDLLADFITTVRIDIAKKNKKDENFRNDYCLAFEYNIKSFIDYYSFKSD